MKGNLAAAFFERDLSSDEELELGRLLRESPEAAAEFAENAAEFYAGLGLPEPEWPGGGESAPGGAGGVSGAGGGVGMGGMGLWGAISIIGGGILAGGGAALYLYMNPGPRAAESLKDIGPTAKTESPRNLQAQRERTAKAASRTPARTYESEPARAPEPEQETAGGAAAPPATGNMLVVRVVLKDASPVQVRIFTEDGTQVFEQSTGILDPGEHKFHWDGLDQKGAVVPAGNYRVELETDKGIMERILKVRNVIKEEQP